MRSKFKWILSLLVAFTMQFSYAQEKTVTGVVSDEFGTLPGASVVVKGTTRGVATDFDGNYSIAAKQGDVLEISFTGKKKVSINVGASNKYDVALVADALEEIVVVGYGTTTKEAFVGTATVVKNENITAKSVTNVSQALKGEVAGVNVITTSGQPGSSATIRIRGFGSVNGNRNPLYVVDGVPFSGGINSINSADIETLTVLKDAAATAVYGSRGANGVIMITTKGGSRNKTTIEADFKTGFNTQLLPRYNTIKSPEEYIGLAWEGKYNRGVSIGDPNPVAYANANLFSGGGIDPGYNMWNATAAQLIDPITRSVNAGITRKYDPENWADYGFQSSLRTETNLRFSGGNDKTKYFSSFGFLDDKGYIINSDFRRYTTRLNLSHKPMDWLTATANIGFSGSRSTNNGQSSDSGSVFWFVDNIPSIYPLFSRDVNGNKIADPYYGGYQYDYGAGTSSRGFGGLTNSIADATYDLDRTDKYEFNGTYGFNFRLHKNLNLETNYGVQYIDQERNIRNNAFYGSAAGQLGSLYKQRERYTIQNFLQLLRYNKSVNDHNFDAFVAHESNSYRDNTFYASKNTSVLGNTLDLNQYVVVSSPPGSYSYNSTLESYFSQFNYNYNNKYYFTASARRDGSSRFKEDKWGTFGSVGASWIVSKESFMANIKPINYFKLKASYGLIGEQAGVGFFPGYDTYTISNLNGGISLPVGANGNSDLTWETSKIGQVGFESTLFNIFDLNIDYYVKTTDDLIFDRRVGPSSGVATIKVNDGVLENSGLEYDLLARVITGKESTDFSLSVGINGEVLTNKIKTMPIEPSTGLPKYIDTSNSPYGWAEGGSIYDFYMAEYAGVDASTGTALWYSYFNDANNDGVFNTGDTTILSLTEYQALNPGATIERRTTSVYANATNKFVGKSAIPDFRGAFRINASYKNFDLSTQFTYSVGGYAYDFGYAGLMANGQIGSNNYHADIRNRWQKAGDITDVPRISDAFDPNVNSRSTRFLVKSDYLGLNNIRLGYTLPNAYASMLKLSKLNFFVSGDNLVFLSKRKGFNASTSESGSSDTYRYSPLSNFTMGVRVEF